MRKWIDLMEDNYPSYMEGFCHVYDLNEIYSIDSSEYPEKQRRETIRQLLNYRDWKTFANGPNGLIYRVRDHNATTRDILMSLNRVAIGYALLHRTDEPVDGTIITEIGLTRWEHEGNGYGKGLYNALLASGETLVSGRQQTLSGQAMWRRLMANPSVEVLLYRDGAIIDQGDPWKDSKIVLVARNA